MDILDCSICTEILVLPVVLTCGHTYCKACVRKLRKKLCPLCRHIITRHGKVCILLETMLKERIPNYDILANDRNELLDAHLGQKDYRISKRYHGRCTMIYSLTHHNKYLSISHLADVLHSNHIVELLYIAHYCNKFIVYPPTSTVSSDQYIIIRSSTAITKFITNNRQSLSEKDIIYLMSKVLNCNPYMAYYNDNMLQDTEIAKLFNIFFASLSKEDLENEDTMDDSIYDANDDEDDDDEDESSSEESNEE
jgi:hypothetical protein